MYVRMYVHAEHMGTIKGGLLIQFAPYGSTGEQLYLHLISLGRETHTGMQKQNFIMNR